MHIEVNTDNHIQGRSELTAQLQALVEDTLGRYADKITRVEVHLSDENGPKKGENDIRCAMEARLEGLKPMGATSHAAEVETAVASAADKLLRVIESTLGRMVDVQSAAPRP